MNIIKINNKVYKYESYWRASKNIKVLDFNNNLFPYPVSSKKEWQNKNLFLEKLLETQNNNNIIKNNKNNIKDYNTNIIKDCLLCHKKNIQKDLYEINRLRWSDSLYHYIDKHNIKPSNEFIDVIFRYDNHKKINNKNLTRNLDVNLKKITQNIKINNNNKITKLNATLIIDKNKKYLKLDRNQILIMDALFVHGGKKIYSNKYSEHYGLLDFNHKGLERVLVSGNTTRVDKNDDEIFMPKNIKDEFDYEYMFHTHPATPKPGGRVEFGILYEFPSISDIFHFIDHFNAGSTQGSIVIAAEGMYIIRKHIFDKKKLEFSDSQEDKLYKECVKIYNKVQHAAIDYYGYNFNDNKFYSDIAQNKTFINEINNLLNKNNLQIDYYPRIHVDGEWLIDTVYLPVYIIEYK